MERFVIFSFQLSDVKSEIWHRLQIC